MSNPLRIATRKSPLALWQAEEVQRRLAAKGVASELVQMSTRGDEILDTPLAKIGGKGLFIKELQKGMLEGRADLAVHSMKDLPAEFPPGLHLAAILSRENPTDAFVSNLYKSLDQLPANAVVGTCSLRRQSQILDKYPSLTLKDLRGNVNTRLKKLDDGEFDAIILASAGLIRLGLEDRISAEISVDEILPACAQGAIGIESKTDDTSVNAILQQLHDDDTAARVLCERSLNARLGGSCQTPIAAFAELTGDQLSLRGLVAMPDGSSLFEASGSDNRNNGVALGNAVAEQLLEAGADKVIRFLAEQRDGNSKQV
ncbi:hydroxymethylbilane synthase [Chromatiales bacterium (ex Bugula neritina AB1)]|nr:hydroxymethylbilane synthase [Chromatiales bacterium (ex Bugula neritina AB1)]